MVVWQEFERVVEAALGIYWRAKRAIFADRGRPPLISGVSSWDNTLLVDPGWSIQIAGLCIVVAAGQYVGVNWLETSFLRC